MDTKIIGTRIKELRTNKKLKQYELAELIDIDEKYLSNIERGVSTCSYKVLLKIANELEASLDYICASNLKYNLIKNENPITSTINIELNKMNDKQQRCVLDLITSINKNDLT